MNHKNINRDHLHINPLTNINRINYM